MIIDNTYFIDEIFIPHAKPSITDDITAVSTDITSFIDMYSKEALQLCLGYALFKEFSAQLDPAETNGLVTGAGQKWDDLLNGKEYTDQAGILVKWNGIRFKTSDAYNKSFLADYTYYYYESSNDDDRTGVGNVKQQAKNALLVSKSPKVTFAWRRFIKAVQGETVIPAIGVSSYPSLVVSAIGIDWYGESEFVSLYKFITDTNAATPDTYKDYRPHFFTNQNQFGI